MTILKELFSVLNEKKVGDEEYFIVVPDKMPGRKGRIDLYTEKAFKSIEAANKFIEKELRACDSLDAGEAGEEQADELRDADVMSGASLKKQYPKLFEGATFELMAKNGRVKRFKADSREEAIKTAKAANAKSLIKCTPTGMPIGKPIPLSEAKEDDDDDDDCVSRQCHAQAAAKSKKEGVVQHINKDKKTGKLYVSDWFDDDETVATYNKGKLSEALNKKKEGELLFLVKSKKKNQQVKVYAKDAVQARDRVAVHDGNGWFTGPLNTDVTTEIIKEAFAMDDIAVVSDPKHAETNGGGGTVIYKTVDGNYKLSKVKKKREPYTLLLWNGDTIQNAAVVSTDYSDWAQYKGKKVVKEARSVPSWFQDGAKVKLMPEYADKDPNEVFTLKSVDTETGKGRIADDQGKGWGISYYQVYPKNKTPAIHEAAEGNMTFTKKDDGKEGKYGVKVGQVYVPADGSKNELKVLSINHASEDALVFDKAQNKERHIDLFKLAKVRYSLKESADLAKQLVRGEKAPKGLMAKLDHWLMKLMIEKDGNRFLPAETAVKALKSYGFSGPDRGRKNAEEARRSCASEVHLDNGLVVRSVRPVPEHRRRSSRRVRSSDAEAVRCEDRQDQGRTRDREGRCCSSRSREVARWQGTSRFVEAV
jgi:hypothetical protein